MRLIGLPGTRADKPKYDFRIRIGGPFLDLGGATESVLLPRLEGRLVNAFDDFSC